MATVMLLYISFVYLLGVTTCDLHDGGIAPRILLNDGNAIPAVGFGTFLGFDEPDGVDEKIDYLETWRAFEDVLKRGLVKAIGVSNFNVQQLQRLLANCAVVPAANQVEINLNLGQKDLVEYCQKNNIQVIAYTPFGSMIPSRSTTATPEPTIKNPTMMGIAKKHGKTVTQVALRYLYQRGIAAIPKSLTKSRIEENASIFDFQLDNDDVARLVKFDVGYRTVHRTVAFWQNFQNYPFHILDMEVPQIPQSLLKWKNGANEDID